MSHREDIVAACRALLAARDAADTAVRDRDDALYAVHAEDGVPYRRVSPLVQGWLRDAGFSEDEIARVGVSTGTVERVVRDRRLH